MEVSVIAACDQKASARKFIRTNHEVRHLFHSLAAMGGVQVNQPACACDICQKPHRLHEEPPADWITGGLPCQSVSAMRQKNGHGTARRAASARTGSVEGHPDFGTVMDGFEAYLACRAPGGFCIEEVERFNSAMPHGGGMTYLALFCETCSRHGYAVRAIMFDHGVWSPLPRRRTAALGPRARARGRVAGS